MLDQAGKRRTGIVGYEQSRPDEQEADYAGDGEAEVEQPGRAGAANQRVNRGPFNWCVSGGRPRSWEVGVPARMIRLLV